MKIAEIRLTPLLFKLRQPYHWAQGINTSAQTVLIEIEMDTGVVGIGESMGGPDNAPVLHVLEVMAGILKGAPAHETTKLARLCYQATFASRGTGSAPRYFAQCFAGIEMALWDAIGKAADVPVADLLGGAVHRKITYFGFIQGRAPDELAASASALHADGYPTLYLKAGRPTAQEDIAAVEAVREAVGPYRRLRLDANEAWDMLTARRMFARLERYDIEMIEQPIPAALGSKGLAELRAVTAIPIAADQAVFSPEDVYDVCRNDAADLVTIGMHETGGIGSLRKAAAIAEAAGRKICNHGVFESGITTCALIQTAATIPNLDDGNQIMWQLFEENIVANVDLRPVDGSLPVGRAPGLGFVLDAAAVERCAKAYREIS